MAADHEHSPRIALLIAVVAFILANAGFYFLSGNYFDAHHQIVAGASVPVYSAEQTSHIRTVFATVSGVLIGVGFIASLNRRIVGHGLTAVLGLGNLVGGVAAFLHDLPGVLTTTLLVAGGAMLVLSHFSVRGSRASWAFLVAICGVFAVTNLFGAPKIRGVLGVSLWATMIIPGLYAVATVVLIQLRGDYADRADRANRTEREPAPV